MKLKVHFIISFILMIGLFQAFSQTNTDKEQHNYSASMLFSDKEPLNISIYIDKKGLLRDIGDNRYYHPALITYHSASGITEEVNAKIQTRGNFRRNPDNCKVPPLSIKFNKNTDDSVSVFKGQKKLKLVVPCMKENQKYQEFVKLEYLIYQIYELLTPVSYKTRLVNVSMIDSIKTNDTLKFIGFFLEETDQLAQRNNGEIKYLRKFHPEQVDRQQMTMLNVFQYLIGNTDWSVEVGHNIKLIFFGKSGVPYAIPFDFDWSGLVSAAYAIPSPKIGTQSVRQRVYRGYYRKIEEYDEPIRLFNEKKEEIYNLFKNCSFISEKSKKSTIEYFDEFYKIINNPKSVQKEFIDYCRKP